MLFTYESGSSSNEAILFLHGGGLSGSSWQPVMQQLLDYYCLAPDLPEQGRSKDIPYSIDGAAAAAAELILKKVPSQKAHVVALSLGGPVAFTLLRTHPELVKSTIISGGSGKFSRFLSELGKATIWMYRLYKPEYLIKETIRQQGIPEEYADLVREDLRIGMAPQFMRHYMTELATWEPPQAVATPLLIVMGEKEMKAGFGIARGYLKRYPNAQGVIAPRATHAWCLQQPDLFARMVQAWIKGQPLPEGFQPLR